MRLFSKLLDAIFVRKCAICGKTVEFGDDISVCKACSKKLKDFGQVIYTRGRFYDKALSALPYKGKIEKSMRRFKFKNMGYLGYTYASILCDKYEGFLADVDIVTSVPMKDRDRNYNQADMIAKEVARISKKKHIENLLIKKKHIPPLSSMGFADRQNAVHGAFTFNESYDIKGKTVAIVDDVFTTGATSNECSKMLKMYGAKKVYVLTACYAVYG